MPKKFSFKLEALLKLKQSQEKALKMELGKAMKKLEEEKEKLLSYEKEKSECEENINFESQKGMSIEKLREYNNYLSGISDAIAIQKENINFAQENVDRYREELIKVRKEGQMLEKLKEKKLSEYMIEMKKEEQLINDEIIGFKIFESEQ